MTDTIEIYVLDKKVRLLQPDSGFRTSLDSVMLAAACPAGSGEHVLDMGCGVGGASFCLLKRLPECFVTGIDIQTEYIDLANKNKIINNHADHMQFIVGNIVDYSVDEPEKRFDHIICNPPFMEAGSHTPSPHGTLATARGHQDEDISLQDWLDAGFRNLKSGGSLTIIHRADMTDRIIRGLGNRFGAIEIFPLWPRAGEPAKRVVVRARKDRRSPAQIHAGLILHKDSENSYTEAADRVLRGGEALF